MAVVVEQVLFGKALHWAFGERINLRIDNEKKEVRCKCDFEGDSRLEKAKLSPWTVVQIVEPHYRAIRGSRSSERKMYG